MTVIPLIVNSWPAVGSGCEFDRLYILGDDWQWMCGRLSVIEVIPSYITLILNV
jgi:hypothetical protein